MYTGDKPNFKVRLRRWWKAYREEIRWKGYIMPLIEDFLPGYYKLNKLYWAFRHRFIDIYHKIDTGLSPEYYDIDTLMVYGMFSFIVRYIEDEKGGAEECLIEITNLENNWGEGWDDITPEEHRQEHINASKNQADNLREALRIYYWWKNVYPKYENYDNNPWHQYCEKKDKSGSGSVMDRMFNTVPCSFDKDGDPTLFELRHDNETSEDAIASRAALDAAHEYEKKCEDDITENLIALIKIRKNLWT